MRRRGKIGPNTPSFAAQLVRKRSRVRISTWAPPGPSVTAVLGQPGTWQTVEEILDAQSRGGPLPLQAPLLAHTSGEFLGAVKPCYEC